MKSALLICDTADVVVVAATADGGGAAAFISNRKWARQFRWIKIIS